MIDPDAERFVHEGQRPIGELFAEYRTKIEAANRTECYIDETLGYLERTAEAYRISILSALIATTIERHAANLRDEGKSARTVQAVLTALKGFTRWATATGKLPRDPLASVAQSSKRPSTGTPGSFA